MLRLARTRMGEGWLGQLSYLSVAASISELENRTTHISYGLWENFHCKNKQTYAKLY